MFGAMPKPTPSRVRINQIAYLVAFGAFMVISLISVIKGTATSLTWVSLIVSALLFAATAYRMIGDLRKPGP